MEQFIRVYGILISKLIRLGLIIGCIVLLTACSNSNKRDLRLYSHALENSQDTGLGKTFSAQITRNPGKSGFYLLGNGLETLALLTYLVDRAEKTLDLQYFLFHHDKTGEYMAYKLLKAADRGVKIRILLDDIYASGMNTFLLAMDAHPNIELRLFNRISEKKWLRYVTFLTNFMRVNRRMHNKVFVVDNQVAVVGGRNIGDAYYTAKKRFLFSDLDIMSIGPIVEEISVSFDTYWNTRWASNIKQNNTQSSRKLINKEMLEIRNNYDKLLKSLYGKALVRVNIGKQLVSHQLNLIWAKYKLFYDPPSKVSGLKKKNSRFLESRIIDYMAKSKSNVRVISPYFVPQRFGMRWVKKLRKKNVNVIFVTNSYASNDARVVHGAYKRYRRRLLKLGVDLYELKPTAFRVERKKADWYKTLPKSTLHIKAIVLDDKHTFISSVNLSPRSRYMNTEIAIMIQGPVMAKAMTRIFNQYANLENSFKVHLVKRKTDFGVDKTFENKLVWITRKKGKIIKFEQEPYVWLFQHLGVSFINFLPIEGLL